LTINLTNQSSKVVQLTFRLIKGKTNIGPLELQLSRSTFHQDV